MYVSQPSLQPHPQLPQPRTFLCFDNNGPDGNSERNDKMVLMKKWQSGW